ncbi:MAG: sigma-54-dependent Fis family transcriptional regulator [Rhizobacter sp.]|nr:sigma-54-dependent Fis family transcriptional regulator [Chlorobiales bacterium]
MQKKILVIDDERPIQEAVRMILEYDGFTVETASDGVQGINALSQHTIDAVMLDIKMVGLDGFEVLRKIREDRKDLPVIIISGHGNIETAVEAIKLGATDFLEKPLDRNRVLVSLRNAIEKSDLQKDNSALKRKIDKLTKVQTDPPEIIGGSAAIQKVKLLIDKVAKTDSRVLITGGNGTGKELVARWIHHKSHRSTAPFVALNCAAIPTELIESELFGHEKGSFTGATEPRHGKFEQAHGGTIFLDEIGDMSLTAQAKVLRVLQENKIQRVGSAKQIEVNVRVLAATNKHLIDEIEKGNFREDLYHRLSVIMIDVPPLSLRREDIDALALQFAKVLAEKNALPEKTLTPAALAKLRHYDWRGNIRELHNIIERLVIMTDRATIDETDVDLFAPLSGSAKEKSATNIFDNFEVFEEFKANAEATFILRKLEKYRWHISKTAEKLGMQRSHLYTKIEKYALQKPKESEE